MAAPWWDSQFSRVDNLGGNEPQSPPAGSSGFYVKPDTNIQLPPGYPVVAISPGTVTNVRQTSWGQTVITVRLDSQVNDIATHQFYEHMSSANVQAGQHVNQGSLLGYNNEGSPPLGFGFYSGDMYGSGSAWEVLQNDLTAHGNNGRLSPVAFLDSMAGIPFTGGGGDSTTSGGVLSFLQKFPGGLKSVPLIMGLLVVVAIGLGTYLIWKEVQ
jgi:murein DD-endopeptidase MepM/ murein hydrolase activator NlpD